MASSGHWPCQYVSHSAHGAAPVRTARSAARAAPAAAAYACSDEPVRSLLGRQSGGPPAARHAVKEALEQHFREGAAGGEDDRLIAAPTSIERQPAPSGLSSGNFAG